MNLETLNETQREAVMTTEGPLLVLAGAGSGKTRVLTTRIAYLIDEKGVNPSEILAITFTNKAAKEMKERVINILGNLAHKIQISTFHSFGLSIIKDNYAEIGFERNFTILDSDDSLTLIKKILKDMNLDSNIYNPRNIKNQISSAKNELVDAEGYKKFAFSEFEKVVQRVYVIYEDKLIVNNSFDFDDLLMKPILLFKEHPDILKKYQERFKFVLIDEYQDTNEAQYVLTKMISEKYKNICVVGDPDQSIYAFRGSNYQNILNFEKDYKKSKVITLDKNYRSTGNILTVANDVIKNNKQRKDKALWTDNDDGNKVIYYRAENEKDEAFYVKCQIERIMKESELSEIAVLYRTNAQSRNIEEALLRENIPYKVVGSYYFYKRKEIKDLIAYLSIIYNEKDDVNLLRIINVPKRGIGNKTIENISIKAATLGKSIYEIIDSGKELQFKSIIEDIKKDKDNLSLTELVELVLVKSGMKQELLSEKSIEAEVRLENLEEFKSITKSFEERNGIISLEEFLMEISLVSDATEYKNNPNSVTLMTVHSAKGLEFDNVFIVGVEEGIFPHINSFVDNNQIEEERRLCYVAITRSRKRLWLINAKRRMLYGREGANPESRFIKEINVEYLNCNEGSSIKIVKQSSIDDTIIYNIGDKVLHDIYGNGIIVSVDKSVLTIAFAHPTGIKMIIKGHSSIRRV